MLRQIVNDYLEKESKGVGCSTGYNRYNQLGLSTQVGNIMQIGTNTWHPSTKRDRHKSVVVHQRNPSPKSIPLLQILDAFKPIKKIPDARAAASCRRFVAIVKELSTASLNTLVILALKYPPATRALLGTFIDQAQQKTDNTALLKSLNPITTYKRGVGKDVLTNAEKWSNI